LVTGSLPRLPLARAATAVTLQQRISAGQGRISNLAGQVAAKNRRINALGGSIGGLRARLSDVQRQLDASIVALRRTQAQYGLTRLRLARLEAAAAHAEAVLSRQVVGTYERPQPSLVTVVVEATGLQDLLENLQFAERVQRQDARIVTAVRAARRAVAAQATKLGALQVREEALARTVLSERDGLARTQIALVKQQATAINSRSATSAQLADARASVADARAELARLQAAQAAARAAARRAAQAAARAAERQAAAPKSSGTATAPAPSGTSSAVSSTAVSSSPSSTTVSSGSGSGAGTGGSAGASGSSGFTFPLPTSAAAPPSAWSLDQGVDISAPGGTPEYAVCSGTIVLHGIGGFGPWAPVLHCDSPLDGYSYVYYGHAGPANQLPVGTHVGAGQVMSEIGPGIVGISSGPHVEMGFCDASGTPLGGGTASTMMSLLRSAYGG
jgi:murein DD-endopeptidase MepM/ murein hydrolase activator NlpD